ncbi:MAG: Fic family protein [Gammaproteobacteria bacterium]|nr:Fic family protein [Gammaproteobacteria bacterium]MCP5435160.1 Fic family protein [Chromatiaceae bacterium]MCP5438105.1 Fic family protein [Chromatiaceae bacterium]
MYIWQQPDWKASQGERTAPAFSWDAPALRPRLDAIRLLQGRLLGQSDLVADGTDQQAQLDALLQTALRTSEIEGEALNAGSVRSSVVRRLGLQKAGFVQGLKDAPGTPQTEALVGLLLEATADTGQPLSIEKLCHWQAALFPEPPLLGNIRIGELRGDEPMQVVSGRIDRPVVHFEAPPRDGLEAELQRFVDWFNAPPGGLDPILRAGIAHLWLITLHPFDDGNGRVTRAVTDRALAQAEQSTIRFYSLSAAIMARRNEYYEQLEAAQKGALDISPWLGWFLSVLEDALHQGLRRFERVVQKTRYWQRHSQTVLSERQIKVLNRLLDGQGEEFEHGINASKYMSIAKVSKATATRELGDLLAKGCLHKLPGGGRSTRYAINDTQGKTKP